MQTRKRVLEEWKKSFKVRLFCGRSKSKNIDSDWATEYIQFVLKLHEPDGVTHCTTAINISYSNVTVSYLRQKVNLLGIDC